MAVLASFIFDQTMRNSLVALNAQSPLRKVDPRVIDNDWADSLGLGTIKGKYWMNASFVNLEGAGPFVTLLETVPIVNADTDMLFAPQPEV